jgi:hypothetical protein
VALGTTSAYRRAMTADPNEQDPFREPLSNELNREIMQAFLRLPAVLQSQVEGEGGAAELPPEQAAEALKACLWIILRYLPKITAQLDVLKADVRQLEERLKAQDD